MLSNQISTKDLFGFSRQGSAGRNDSSCSQGNSQFQSSQLELSQLSYQDSQILPESQSLSDSPGRRMYQKYMSKGSLFKPEGSFSNSIHSNQTQVNHQQFIQMQKVRARERDERDLLRSIVSTVNDSSAEVRQVLQSFTDSIEAKQGSNLENLTSSLEKLSDDVKKSCDKVIESVVHRENTKEELNRLQIEITKRDTIIDGLEKQVKQYQMTEEHSLLEVLKDYHLKQQDILEEKLQKLLNVTSEQLKLYDKQVLWQTNQETEQKAVHKMYKEQQTQLKCLHDRLLSEMVNMQSDFDNKHARLGNYYKQQLQESRRQAERVENSVEAVLSEGLTQAVHNTSSMFSQQKHELDKTCDRHRQEMQHFVKTELAKQMTEYEKKINKLVSNLQSETSRDESESRVTSLKAVENNCSKGMWVTLPLRGSNSQVERAETSAGNKYRCDFESITIKSPELSVTSSYNRPSMSRPGGNLFTSPWSSKALFGRVKPSPVATVPPMVQATSKAMESSQEEGVTSTTSKQRQRKQKGIIAPQRRSQRLNKEHKDSVVGPEFEQMSCNRSVTLLSNPHNCKAKVTQPVAVPEPTCNSRNYDFEDELPSSSQDFLGKRKQTSWDAHEPEWLKVARIQQNSPGKSSVESSPSMSMMEVVIKRKVKCDRTPRVSPSGFTIKKSTAGDQTAVADLLSTPCFKSYDIPESSYSQDPFVWEGKISRKNTGKRKLCDVNYDTQITEITSSIRRHLQRVKPRC